MATLRWTVFTLAVVVVLAASCTGGDSESRQADEPDLGAQGTAQAAGLVPFVVGEAATNAEMWWSSVVSRDVDAANSAAHPEASFNYEGLIDALRSVGTPATFSVGIDMFGSDQQPQLCFIVQGLRADLRGSLVFRRHGEEWLPWELRSNTESCLDKPFTTTLPEPPSAWTPLPASPLSPRDGHSAVWTGEELIFWGGSDKPGQADPFANDGAAYDPVQSTWRTIAEAPIGKRLWHSAVWTGREMLIWGGFGDIGIDEAGAYDPASDTWRRIADGPIAHRSWGHSTLWTGIEMIIWGNRHTDSDEPLGVAYNPTDDTWRVLPEPPIDDRAWHSAVWSGEEMIIWGGETSLQDGEQFVYQNDGAAYKPSTDTWRLVSAAPIEGRWQHTAVWASPQMIVWGGAASDRNLDARADGASYEPETDTWSMLRDSPLEARNEHTAFWTDLGMLVWGGHVRTSGSTWNQYADGAIYDPVRASWIPIPQAPVTGTRNTTPSAWTGDQLIYWGRGNDFSVTDGAAHEPTHPSGDSVAPAAAPTTTLHTSTTLEDTVPATLAGVPESCPVTVPGDQAFTPASEAPEEPPEVYEVVWYGTPDLWTMINPEGETAGMRWLQGEKTFWWSQNYSPPGDPAEITVTAEHLNGSAPTFQASVPAGLGHNPFMLQSTHKSVTMVGIHIPEPGCWELTAEYKGATLSYVVWVSDD